MTHPSGKSQARLIAADFLSLCFFVLWIGLATGVILGAAVLVLSRGAAAAAADAHREAVQAHELATKYASLAGFERAALALREHPVLGTLRQAATDRRVQLLAGAAVLMAAFLLLHLRRRRATRALISFWTYPTYPDPDVPIGMESALPAFRRERLKGDPGAT